MRYMESRGGRERVWDEGPEDHDGEHARVIDRRDVRHLRVRRHQVAHHGPVPPACNGVAERMISVLINNAVRAMLPTRASRAEDFCTGTYVRNKTPTKALDRRTPYEMLYGVKSDRVNLRAFAVPMV